MAATRIKHSHIIYLHMHFAELYHRSGNFYAIILQSTTVRSQNLYTSNNFCTRICITIIYSSPRHLPLLIEELAAFVENDSPLTRSANL